MWACVVCVGVGCVWVVCAGVVWGCGGCGVWRWKGVGCVGVWSRAAGRAHCPRLLWKQVGAAE